MTATLSRARAFFRQSMWFEYALVILLTFATLRSGSFAENIFYLAILLPFIFAVRGSEVRELAANPVLICFAFYLLTLAISGSGPGEISGASRWADVNRMAGELAFVVFIVWFVRRQGTGSLLWLAVALACGVFVSAIISLWSYGFHFKAPLAPLILWPWPNQNTGAIVATVAVGALANAAVNGSSAIRLAFASVLIVLLVVIALSGSRVCLGLAFVMILSIPVIYGRTREVGFFFLALILLIILADIANIIDIRALVARGDASRVALWRLAVEQASLHPWRGVGVENEFKIIFRLASGELQNNPHNMLILSLLYGGIPAGFAWSALMVSLCVAAYRGARQRNALAAAFTALVMIYTLVESVLLTTRPNWQWLVYLVPFGVIAAAWRPAGSWPSAENLGRSG